MKSSVYKIVGCAGSQTIREVENCLDFRQAKKNASRRNRETADAFGVTFRDLVGLWK